MWGKTTEQKEWFSHHFLFRNNTYPLYCKHNWFIYSAGVNSEGKGLCQSSSSPPHQGSHNEPLRPSVCLVLTLCDPVDCSPLGSSVHGDSPGKNNGVRSHLLLQGVSPTQGSNPGLPHCRRILYQLIHQGSHGGVPQAWYCSAFIWLPCR